MSDELNDMMIQQEPANVQSPELDVNVKAVEDANGQKEEKQLPENPLEFLLQAGKEQGAVTYDEILEVMPEAETNMDLLEDVFSCRRNHGFHWPPPMAKTLGSSSVKSFPALYRI